MSTVHLIPAAFNFFIDSMAIFSTSLYPYINGSVEKHNCTDLILSFSLGISLSNKASVFEINFGLHQSL